MSDELCMFCVKIRNLKQFSIALPSCWGTYTVGDRSEKELSTFVDQDILPLNLYYKLQNTGSYIYHNAIG